MGWNRNRSAENKSKIEKLKMMKIENADKSSSAGTEDESSTNVQDKQVSQPIAKPLVVGSASCQQGYKGACCCNCKYQLKLFCHPLNGENKEFGFLEDKVKFGKGSISKQCGWACINPEICEGKSAIFFDKEHGMCECWSLRS